MARTLVKEGPLRLTLIGLGLGGTIRPHQAEMPLTILVLEGEITLVLGAGTEAAGPEPSASVDAVAELVAAGVSRRQAAEVVSRLTGTSRNELYRRTL